MLVYACQYLCEEGSFKRHTEKSMWVYQSSGGPIIVSLHYIELCVL